MQGLVVVGLIVKGISNIDKLKSCVYASSHEK